MTLLVLEFFYKYRTLLKAKLYVVRERERERERARARASERACPKYKGKFFVLSLVTQLCLTLSDPMDYSSPGSPVHGDSPGKNTEVGFHALLQEVSC